MAFYINLHKLRSLRLMNIAWPGENKYFLLKRNMNFKFFAFFCWFISYVSASVTHHHHDDVLTRDKLVGEIAEHLGTTKSSKNQTLFKYRDLEKLFKELNFKNCSGEENSTRCNMCLTPKDFISWYKYSLNTTYSEDLFREIQAGVLHFLIFSSPSPESKSAVCKTFKKQITASETSSLFKFYLSKYGNKNKLLDENSLSKILADVNKTVGNQLSSKKCFTVHDVVKGANVSEHGFGEHGFEYVSTFIIVKLLDKNCIKHEQPSTLPKRSEFVEGILSEFGNKTHMTHENFEALVKKLKLGSKIGATTVVTSSSEYEHNHRKRRSVTASKLSQCYSAEDLLTIFSVPEGSTLDATKFQEVCPSLVQQIESGVCTSKSSIVTPAPAAASDRSWRSWVGAMVSIAIISVGSLLGVMISPYNKKSWFPYLIMYLIALAVATLLGDTLLHLIPHALDLHKHEEGAHQHSSGNHFLKSDSFLWKMMCVLVGFYLFYMFELLMHAFSGHSHSHGGDIEAHSHVIPTNNSIQKTEVKGTLQLNEENVIKNNHSHKSEIINTPSGIHKCQNEDVVYFNNSKGEVNLKYISNGNNGKHEYAVSDNKDKKTLVSQNSLSIKSFKSVVWTVLIGDGIHNFMDGMAIGVAFSEVYPSGLHGGISTSIAILCHELPHELGDFAILISSGLSIKQALVMNFIASLTAFGGGLLGVALGTQWNASPWIFSITAGLFIYISLVDMLPEVLHSNLLKTRPYLCVSVQNLGLFTGFAIMFALAAWEEDIKSALK